MPNSVSSPVSEISAGRSHWPCFVTSWMLYPEARQSMRSPWLQRTPKSGNWRNPGTRWLSARGPSAGLNADVTRAVNTLQGMGAKRITVIHADLPLATAQEIDRVCGVKQNSRTTDTPLAAVISPSADHQGTNVLSFDAVHPIPFRYGPNSFNLHREIAQETGAELVTIESETLSIDIDEPSDLEQLLAHGNRHPEYASSASWRFLQRAGLTSIDRTTPLRGRFVAMKLSPLRRNRTWKLFVKPRRRSETLAMAAYVLIPPKYSCQSRGCAVIFAITAPLQRRRNISSVLI